MDPLISSSRLKGQVAITPHRGCVCCWFQGIVWLCKLPIHQRTSLGSLFLQCQKRAVDQMECSNSFNLALFLKSNTSARPDPNTHTQQPCRPLQAPNLSSKQRQYSGTNNAMQADPFTKPDVSKSNCGFHQPRWPCWWPVTTRRHNQQVA
jgi:hypothetical protein